MRASLYLATSAFVLVSAVTALGDIAWRPDLQTAHREALSSGKLLLVHFYGDNCAWCDKLEEGAFKDPTVVDAINRDFVPVKVHGTRDATIAQHFGVTQWPTDVIVDSSGLVHGRGTSPQLASQYVAMLGTSLAHAGRPMIGQPTNTAIVQNTAPSSSLMVPPSAAPTAPNPTVNQTAANKPAEPIAMEGFCPVTVVEQEQWVPGDRRWGAIHLGQTFLFASEDAQKKFLADPHRYAPILTGYDVVQFFEKKTLVPGNREWACKFNGRTYLFADQQSYDRFYANCEQFDQMANRVHERMAMDANTDGNLRR